VPSSEADAIAALTAADLDPYAAAFVIPDQARLLPVLNTGPEPRPVTFERDVPTDIVLRVRLPRIGLAAAVGAALAVSGVLFQALLRNELAEPYLLGVGPGALLGVTAAALIAGAGGLGPDRCRGGPAAAAAADATSVAA